MNAVSSVPPPSALRHRRPACRQPSIFPLCSTSTRSATSASSTRCVAHSTRRRARATSARMAASRSRRDFGSSPTVGFVHQQHRGAMQQRAHEFDLAPIAARQLAHRAVEIVGLQPDRGAAAVDALARERAGQPVQIGVEAQVAAHRQIQIERHLLEHDADLAQRRHRLIAQRMAGHAHLAGVGGEEPGEHLEQGRLAGAVGAEQRDDRCLRSVTASSRRARPARRSAWSGAALRAASPRPDGSPVHPCASRVPPSGSEHPSGAAVRSAHSSISIPA